MDSKTPSDSIVERVGPKMLQNIPDLMASLAQLNEDSVQRVRKTAEDPPRVTWLIFAENIVSVTLLPIIAQCGASAELLATYLPRPSQLARNASVPRKPRSSRNAGLRTQLFPRSACAAAKGLRREWCTGAKICVLACQNQPIQVECLRRTLKRLQITHSPIHKPKSSNSVRCKVKQYIA